MRRAWIEPGEAVAVVRQCVLAGVSRATIYAQQKPAVLDESELLHRRLIDEEYTRHPFYGSRRMVIFLGKAGHLVNRKRVQRLMRLMGRKRSAPPPLEAQDHAGLLSGLRGNNSSMRLFGQEGSFSRVSVSQAMGSMSFMRAVSSRD